MSNLEGDKMDRQAFLLLPQRKYKALLPKDGSGSLDARFKANVSVSKKVKYAAAVDVTQEPVKKEIKATFGVVFRSEPKLFKRLISFFEPKEVCYIAMTSKKTLKHFIDYPHPLSYHISVPAFALILETGKDYTPLISMTTY